MSWDAQRRARAQSQWGNYITTLCQHAITRELNHNSLCCWVIIQREGDFPRFGFSRFCTIWQGGKKSTYEISKTAQLLDNYGHIANIFVWADENRNLLFWHSSDVRRSMRILAQEIVFTFEIWDINIFIIEKTKCKYIKYRMINIHNCKAKRPRLYLNSYLSYLNNKIISCVWRSLFTHIPLLILTFRNKKWNVDFCIAVLVKCYFAFSTSSWLRFVWFTEPG